jgi:hypothetical protein
MAIYHSVTKPLSRSTGRSAVAAAAYRAGACLCDERQGLQHDYTRRPGVLHAELVVPEGASAWTRAALWNAAERAAKQKNSRTAREWEVALPMELPVDAQWDLAVRFARSLVTKYGCAVDVTLHEPDRGSDPRNWHAQLLATTRKVTADRLGKMCDRVRGRQAAFPWRRHARKSPRGATEAELVNRLAAGGPSPGAGGSPVAGTQKERLSKEATSRMRRSSTGLCKSNSARRR